MQNYIIHSLHSKGYKRESAADTFYIFKIQFSYIKGGNHEAYHTR